MRKHLLTLICALCALSFIPSSVMATDYTVEPTTATPSNTLPVFVSSSSYYSITQHIFLPSEFSPTGASEGDIKAITFYYGAKTGGSYTAEPLTRKIKIYLMQVPSTGASKVDSFAIVSHKVGATTDYVPMFLCDENGNAGENVFDNSFTTNRVTTAEGAQPLKLNITPFHWDGSSNIVMTVIDMSDSPVASDAVNNFKFYITATDHARFAHYRWPSASASDRSNWIKEGGVENRFGDRYPTSAGKNNVKDQADGHSYIPKTTFTIVTTIPAPTGLAASEITASSATLSWNTVSSATSYNVRWGKNSGNLDQSQNNVAGTSLDIDELEEGETYYFQVQTVTAGGTSSYSDAASFETTAITITYKDIVFKKWSSTSSLPSEAGNYYLNDDVALSAQYTLPGDINLCLNGNDVYTETKNIVVPDAKTLAIYDNIGGGRIYGYYVADITDGYGLISVENGGALILGEGAVENLYGYYVDEEDPSQSEDPDASYAISVNNGGSFKLSGAPTLSAAKACIYLLTMFPRITIESGKPLTNLSAYSVDASGQTITSGWANMGDVDPNVHFVSKKSTHKGITLNEGEVKFVSLSDLDVSLNESSAENESKLTAELGNDVSLAITRSSLTNAQYNTICLPYAMSNAEMQLRFGVGYDLEEFVSSSLDGDELSLEFSPVTSLEAGKPYLLKPSINAPALSYLSVNIAAASPVDQTSDANISFHGTFNPTSLTGGNKNLLFLGAGNELFWPDATGNLKGFRAYFEVKGAAQKAAKRARIVKKEDSATGIDQITNDKSPMTNKIIKDGQLLILRDNKTYNVIGQMVK